MWADWIPAAIVVALITGTVSIYGVRQTRKTTKETNRVNEADRLIQNLAAEVARQDGRLDQLDKKLQEQGEQINRMQAREWSLIRYIYRCIDRFRALGEEPPRADRRPQPVNHSEPHAFAGALLIPERRAHGLESRTIA